MAFNQKVLGILTAAVVTSGLALTAGPAAPGAAAKVDPPQKVVDSGTGSILRVVSAGDATSIHGSWLAEDLMGGGVIDRLRTVVEIDVDGRVSGSSGCNAIGGMAEITADTVRFDNLVSTQKMCVPAAMDQERKFFDVLAAARAWQVDVERQKLTLLDGTGSRIAIFARD